MFDAIALHAYRSTAGWSRWNGLRWRLYPRPEGLPIYVTETGWDRVRDGLNGTWLPSADGDSFGPRAASQGSLDDDAILAGLTSYDIELRQDGVYAVVFTTSPDDTWRGKGFDLDSIAARANFTNIGPHDLLGVSPEALDWASRASIVKSVDQTAAIRRAKASAIKVYRRRFSEVEQTAILRDQDVTRLVGAIIEGLAGYRDDRLYVELLNEIGKGDRSLYVALCAKVVPQLRAIGLKVAGPSWATGDYEADDWAAFVKPIAGGAIGSDGPRVKTIGGLLHSTRSGNILNTLEQEGDATLNYALGGGDNYNVIITPTRVIPCVPKPLGAWHAEELNKTHLAYGLAQPTINTPFHPGQYKLLARELFADSRVYGWPLTRVLSSSVPGYVQHSDTAQGKRHGKTDLGPLFDWGLLARELTALAKKPYNIEDDRGLLWAMKDRMKEHGYPRFSQAIEGITTMSKGER